MFAGSINRRQYCYNIQLSFFKCNFQKSNFTQREWKSGMRLLDFGINPADYAEWKNEAAPQIKEIIKELIENKLLLSSSLLFRLERIEFWCRRIQAANLTSLQSRRKLIEWVNLFDWKEKKLMNEINWSREEI